MAGVFLNLPATTGDGVAAGVDVSSQGPERTITVDGGAFGGSVFIEGSNDGQASWFPVAGPFVGPTQQPQTIVATVNFLRVRRTSSGGAGLPVVNVGGAQAVANVFGAMNVPAGDGVGTATDLSVGGDVNTFNVGGTLTGQILIETSLDGANFSPTLLFDAAGGAPQQVMGALKSARVRRRSSSPGATPLVGVGSSPSNGSALANPLVLSASLASIMPYGDSTTVGLHDNTTTASFAAGNDQTGGWRQYCYQQWVARGVRFNSTLFKGAMTATTPNLPIGMRQYQATSGETIVVMTANYAARIGANPAAALAFTGGENDINNYLTAHPGDNAGAAATCNTAFQAFLAQVQATTPNIIVACSTPCAGNGLEAATALYTPLMKQSIAAAVAGGLKVYLAVDQNNLSYNSGGGLWFDDLHPNAYGYFAWGGLWANGLLACPY